jgi:hypothetical protein
MTTMAGRTVPADHFGALVYACLDRNVATARAAVMPFVPRGALTAQRSSRAPRLDQPTC